MIIFRLMLVRSFANNIDQTNINPLENVPETENRFTLKTVNTDKVLVVCI